MFHSEYRSNSKAKIFRILKGMSSKFNEEEWNFSCPIRLFFYIINWFCLFYLHKAGSQTFTSILAASYSFCNVCKGNHLYLLLLLQAGTFSWMQSPTSCDTPTVTPTTSVAPCSTYLQRPTLRLSRSRSLGEMCFMCQHTAFYFPSLCFSSFEL